MRAVLLFTSIHSCWSACLDLSKLNSVESISTDSGNVLAFNSAIGPIHIGIGGYYLDVPTAHPIEIIGTDAITINASSGIVELSVSTAFETASWNCLSHGAMGGTDSIIYDDACEPRFCCLAMTASCLACAAEVSVEQYCKKNPQTQGCEIDCPRCAPGSTLVTTLESLCGTCIEKYEETCYNDPTNTICPELCTDDKDCQQPSEWCRSTASDDHKQCVPTRQEGDYCGGYVPPWMESRCSQNLNCYYSWQSRFGILADAPGTCQLETCDASHYLPVRHEDECIPKQCKNWFDGCNNCVIENGAVMGCTELSCDPFEKGKPRCTDIQCNRETELEHEGNCVPKTCALWFDGCNNCSVNTDSGLLACTRKACMDSREEPACIEYRAQSNRAITDMTCEQINAVWDNEDCCGEYTSKCETLSNSYSSCCNL